MFGLYEDRHHARFASDLLVENNPRLNVFALLRSGALTDGVVTRLKWGEKACQLTAQRTGILLDDGEQPAHRDRMALAAALDRQAGLCLSRLQP